MEKPCTTNGTQSLTASLPVFLRVKGTYAFLRSVLSHLFILPLYRLHVLNSISRICMRLFFLPQLPISTWLRGETGDEKLVELYL